MKTAFVILFLATLLFLSLDACAETTKVVVIDTGINKHKFIPGTNGLCPSGHKDFTGSGMDDDTGHGTNVSGIIHKYAKNHDYCQVIVKYYRKDLDSHFSLMYMVLALRYAKTLKPDVVNISASGQGFSLEEFNAIKDLLDSGIAVIVAAGNDGKQLNSMYCDLKGYCSKFNAYPAGHDKRLLVIGNRYPNGDIYPASNYGELVDAWRPGINIEGAYGGVSMTGTSQATAIFTGEYVQRISRRLQ